MERLSCRRNAIRIIATTMRSNLFQIKAREIRNNLSNQSKHNNSQEDLQEVAIVIVAMP